MARKLLLGYDLGSSSVKGTLLDSDTGEVVNSSFSPEEEMTIDAPVNGWAEQNPAIWWQNVVKVTKKILSTLDGSDTIAAIGISYQMHGLVMLDKENKVLYPSIIWCDSRAVETGNKAYDELGKHFCNTNFLNSPGNFTASKLKWVKENLPDVYRKINKVMLPGDYIALKLSGEVQTTISGLSEGILWNYKTGKPATEILDYYGINSSLLSDITPSFGIQGTISPQASVETGLPTGIPITYRAGDQPNNAFSLNVLKPGEVAATGGTSGVVYGVTDKIVYDQKSRVNTFCNVNYTLEDPLMGVLLCINGTGSAYSWLKSTIMDKHVTYQMMDEMADNINIGSDNLLFLPFGNGAERSLENRNMGSLMAGINFNLHSSSHFSRAVQEGIAFAFKYGIDIMTEMGLNIGTIKAGNANMFLSPIFNRTLSSITNSEIHIYNTDGAQGAARAAGIGAGIYKSFEQAFDNLSVVNRFEPDNNNIDQYSEAYSNWKQELESHF